MSQDEKPFHNSNLTEKEQLLLLQNKLGSLYSEVHASIRHIAKIELAVKGLMFMSLLNFALVLLLVILRFIGV